jgi:hypothetical protein
MQSRRGWFNRHFCLALALLLGTAAGAAVRDKKPRDPDILRFYLESPRDTTERATAAMIGRSSPVPVTIEKLPVLTESHLKQIELVDDAGGFSLRVTFNRLGRRLLENYSATRVGRRLVVQTEFEEARWLAAPVISRRLADGVLQFTPDATREEVERLVRGLSKVAKKNPADPAL